MEALCEAIENLEKKTTATTTNEAKANKLIAIFASASVVLMEESILYGGGRHGTKGAGRMKRTVASKSM